MNPNLPPMHRLRVRALPDDMVQKVLDQLVEGTPPEDLCGRLYERCLLLLGSGQCPPDHPVWAQACRRFGVMQKGEGLGTWQATFRAFCKEVARLPPHIRATLWKFVRGDGASVPHENFEALYQYFHLRAPGSLDDVLPVVYGALKHFGLFDPEAREVLSAWRGSDPDENVQKILQLIDGHPREGVRVLVAAIRSPPRSLVARRLIPALLAAGVPTETLVRDRETLLHYAVRMNNANAVALLLEAGADRNARNAEGWTAAEMAVKKVIQDHDALSRAWGWAWANDEYSNDPDMLQMLQLLWPEAAAEWRAMSNAERHAAVRDGWSPGGT